MALEWRTPIPTVFAGVRVERPTPISAGRSAEAMLRRAVSAAALLWAAPASAQIVVTSDAYDAFSGATYIEDDESNIVLTVQREMGRNGMNIRGLRDGDGLWRVEYFCEPDTVLIVENGRRAQSYYLPYLSWSSMNYVTDDMAVVESRRLPSMGTFRSLLPASVDTPQPDAEIRVRHQLRRGSGLVESLVTITNRANTPQRMTYVYQDAAYMWYPDGDQKNTESIRIAVSSEGVARRMNVASAGPTAPGQWQFVGTFNREHGVIAGILSVTPGEVAGISGEYVGVNVATIDDRGYYRARRDFRHSDIPSTDTEDNVRDLPFVNRFIAMDFGTLAPGQTRTLPYFRIMAVLPEDQRTDDAIQQWVSAEVSQMYRDAAAQAAVQHTVEAPSGIALGDASAGQ